MADELVHTFYSKPTQTAVEEFTEKAETRGLEPRVRNCDWEAVNMEDSATQIQAAVAGMWTRTKELLMNIREGVRVEI